MTLGKSIRAKRMQLNLSQRELAAVSGVSVQMISCIEKEQRNPTVNVVQKLARALHCTVGELLGERSA